MEHRSVWFPGVPLALGAAMLFGASTPFSKLLLGSVDPWLLAGILYLGAGIGLSLFLLVRAVTTDQPAEKPRCASGTCHGLPPWWQRAVWPVPCC